MHNRCNVNLAEPPSPFTVPACSILAPYPRGDRRSARGRGSWPGVRKPAGSPGSDGPFVPENKVPEGAVLPDEARRKVSLDP